MASSILPRQPVSDVFRACPSCLTKKCTNKEPECNTHSSKDPHVLAALGLKDPAGNFLEGKQHPSTAICQRRAPRVPFVLNGRMHEQGAHLKVYACEGKRCTGLFWQTIYMSSFSGQHVAARL